MWLAIDTATEIGSVAVGGGPPERVVGARSMRGARQHAAQIVPLIQEGLEESGVQLARISGLVVGDGPGSFTGLRISWAVAKGLAQERELPLVAVPSLLGAAHAAAGGQAGPIVACFDALRGQVFAAIYKFFPARVETVVAPGLFEVRELVQIAPSPDRPLLAVGDGAQRREVLTRQRENRGTSGFFQRQLPAFRRLYRVRRAEHPHIRHGAQRRQMLHRLMRGTVFAQPD